MLEALQQSCHGGTITVVGIEQQALEIGRHDDIHRGCQRGRELFLGEVVSRQRAVQNIVSIGGNDELLHRQAHLVSHVARKDVAEVSRGHAEAYFPLGSAQRHACGHVVDDLGHDARPVDRIHCHKPRAVQEALIGKAGLDHRLGVVEVAFDGDVEDVVGEHRGHLTTLHFGDAVVGVQYKNIQVVAVAAAFDGRRAGVARGGAHDHRAFTTLFQEVIQQSPQQLQRHVFKRQRRAVELL